MSILQPSDKLIADVLSKTLREELIASAENAIQEALKKIEQDMRARLGEMVVGYLQHNYDVYRNGSDLMIKVHFGAPSPDER